ncbi:hypothetical protein ACQVQY_31905 [Bacillus mycoides]|uniref:hypothetical protein n=1 Tax=Bacillus mycoides TaxID=1405 RepID=UPI003D655770
MSTFEPDFRKVQAFGRQGDEKNDGFIKTKGEYYQCYGPENISKESTEKYALKKLQDDFVILLEKWDNRWKIKKFSYVINDKYEGTPPSIWVELAALQNAYSEISFDSLDSQGLENIFINNLNKNQRRKIVGKNAVEIVLEMQQSSSSIQPANDSEMLVWLELINKSIQEKTSKISKLQIKDWYYADNPHMMREYFIDNFITFLDNQEEMEENFLKFLKKITLQCIIYGLIILKIRKNYLKS